MSKYLIKMKPLNTFFFGQENKYRKKRNASLLEAEYFQRSAYFPQQTTLLGALRYCILQMNGQIPIKDKDVAEKLIGKNSFKITNETLGFGGIYSLSPVFLLDNEGKPYFQNPKDLILKTPKGEKKSNPEYLQKTIAEIKSSHGKLVNFPNYKEKNGLDNFLLHSENDFLPYDFDQLKDPTGVFVKKEKIGIRKKKDGEADEEGFYKQISFSLRDKFAFAIIAEIADHLVSKNQLLTSMGAEKSPFNFEFYKLSANSKMDWLKPFVAEQNLANHIKLQNTNATKVILLSDAFLSDYSEKDFQFAISQSKTFRFIVSEVRTGNNYYSSNPLEKKELTRSCKYSLLERGSVFFFDDETQLDTFCDKLKQEENFYTIGYNHFKIIK